MDEQNLKYPKYYDFDKNTWDRVSIYTALFREMYRLRQDDTFQSFANHFSDCIGEKLNYYFKCIELEESGYFAKELACEQNGKIYYKLENNDELLDLISKIYFYVFCLRKIITKEGNGIKTYNCIFNFWNKIDESVLLDISEIYDFYGGNPEFIDDCGVDYDISIVDFLFEELLKEFYNLQKDENYNDFLEVLAKYAYSFRFCFSHEISKYVKRFDLVSDLEYYLKCFGLEKANYFEDEDVYFKDGCLYTSLAGLEYETNALIEKISYIIDKIIINGLIAEEFYKELDFIERELDKKTSLADRLPYLYSIEIKYAEQLKDYHTINAFWSKLTPELLSALTAFHQFGRIHNNMADIPTDTEEDFFMGGFNIIL